MDNLKKATHVCMHSFRKLIQNPRTLVILILLSILIIDLEKSLLNLSRSVDVPITPWIFPFVMSTYTVSPLIMFGIILLFCDAPFFDQNYPYTMIRSGRSVWVSGQLLYIGLATLCYFTAVILLSIIFITPNILFSDNWGKVISTLAQTNMGTQFLVPLSFPYAIIAVYTPAEAMLLTLLMSWLGGVLVGLLTFLANLLFKRGVGSALSVFFVLFTMFTVNGSGNLLYYVSPLNWLDINALDITGTSSCPSIMYAVVCFVVIIAVLTLLSMLTMKKRDIKVLPPI